MWDVSGTVQVQRSCYQEHIEDKKLSSAPDRCEKVHTREGGGRVSESI